MIEEAFAEGIGVDYTAIVDEDGNDLGVSVSLAWSVKVEIGE
jgi:hypothetical protein